VSTQLHADLHSLDGILDIGRVGHGDLLGLGESQRVTHHRLERTTVATRDDLNSGWKPTLTQTHAKHHGRQAAAQAALSDCLYVGLLRSIR
jgi:hypothetical protein